VIPDTTLYREHPDWLLDPRPISKIRDYHTLSDAYVLNLGLPEAQDWFTNLIIDYIEKIPLGYFRHDFNHGDVLGVWRQADAPGRKGITEIKYVQGLYAVLDRLVSMFPDVVMEGCASGGRRIDLETLRRNHLYWKADHIYREPEAHQSQLWGGLHWLPGGFLNTQVLRLNENPYWLHSAFGGSLMIGWDPTRDAVVPSHPYFNKDAYDPELAREQIDAFKSVRHLFSGDFFPLTPYCRQQDDSAWIGWQFHREDLDEGCAVLFRREKAPDAVRVIKLEDVRAGGKYRVEVNGRHQIFSGSELAKGIDVTIQKAPGSVLIHYKTAE
jgi:alpha-galactosidase